MKITLVLDANTTINTIQSYDSTKKSILHHLKDNPMFSIIAPPIIEAEVLKFIDDVEQQPSRKKLQTEWKKLKKIIQIKEVTDKKIQDAALKLTANRDPKDSQYVALYIETNSDAILTRDKDFDDFSVRKFDIEKLDHVVGTFHRGIYSFFIFHDALPLVLELSGKIVAAIIKNTLEFLTFMISIMKNVATKSFEKLIELFSNIPKGAQKAIGAILLIGGLISLIIIALRDDIRDNVSKKISIFVKKIKKILEKIIQWISNAIDVLTNYAHKTTPYAITSLKIITEIQKHVDAIAEELNELSMDPASYA